MYKIENLKAERVEPVTFSAIEMKESEIEEILRRNIDMLCDDEESMIIVGQQVKNENNGRSDLTAIDNEGSIVLVEIKRDPRDIENRKEAFEFQAVRYAASYATIRDIESLVRKVYGPYIEKHREEFEQMDLTSYELGLRKINEFLRANDTEKSFNKRQRIILAASDFDEQTLSAVAWLNSNGVDISCYRLIPYKLDDKTYIRAERILPVATYDQYYVNLMDRSIPVSAKTDRQMTRRVLPRIDAMLEWGIVKEGDIIGAKDREDEGVLQNSGKVKVAEELLSLQEWLKRVYGWSSVRTYSLAIHKATGKTLSQIREEYMIEQEQKRSSVDEREEA